MFVLNVEGMSCGKCVRHVTDAILAQDAKAKVEVKLSEKRVLVETTADLEKIKRAIQDDGYTVVSTEMRP